MSFEATEKDPAQKYLLSVEEIIRNAKPDELDMIKELFDFETEIGPEKFNESEASE